MDEPSWPDLRKDVFAYYGACAYRAHVMEKGLVNALATVYWPVPPPWPNEDEYKGRWHHLGRLSMGTLVHRLRTAGMAPYLAAELRVGTRETTDEPGRPCRPRHRARTYTAEAATEDLTQLR